MNTVNPTRVALIGCGAIATTQHLPAYEAAASAGLCRLVGVCDLDAERARSAASHFGVPAFEDVDEMLSKTKPDAVSIATLPSSHLDLTVRCLDAGCHVLCEKPVANDAAEAAQMVQAAEHNDRLLSICFEYRYWEEARYLKDRIARGDLGHVHAVRTWGGSAHGLPGVVHRSKTPYGSGVLAHWTIHNLDLALWVLGNPEPVTASAFSHQRVLNYPEAAGSWAEPIDTDSIDPTFEDFAIGFIRLAGGTVLTVEANHLQPPMAQREGWAFLTDRGAASLSPIGIWLDDGETWRDNTPSEGAVKACDYDMRPLINGFLQAIREEEEAPVSGAEIIRIQRLMDALYQSAACGTEVEMTSSS